MAKEKKVKNIEETLWDSANKLRGSVESSEYKHVVLGLIFLKFGYQLTKTSLISHKSFEPRYALLVKITSYTGFFSKVC